MRKLALLALMICVAMSTVSSAALLREIWSDTTTSNLDEALAVVNGEVAPDIVDLLDQAGWTDRADNYVAKLSGILKVPADGDYTFYTSGDDHNGLYVSQDADAANAVQVAYVDGWSNWLQWDAQPSQKAEPMTLAAGQLMAVYGVMREGGGGDNYSIGWTGPGIDSITLIDGSYFRPTLEAVSQAADPVPADGATGVEDTTLSWSGPWDNDAPSYTVYAGTDPEALEPLVEGISETSIMVGELGVDVDYDTTYYWRVDVGDVVGQVWSLTTQTAAPVVTAVADAVVLPGGTAELSVEASSISEGELSYQWYRDKVEMMGIVLTDVPLPEGVGPVLTVSNATIADEGNYYCVVSNAYGSATSDLVILDVQVGLIHRYSFTDDASDSVGGADGVLVNNTGAAAFVDGQAVMGNDGSQSNDSDTGDYIDLPNGLISSLTQLTVNVWATYTDQNLAIWSRVLSFGESNDGEDRSASGSASTYCTIQPNRSGNVAGIEYRNKGAVSEFTLDGRVPLDEEILYTWVHDDIAGTYKLYLNGVVQNGNPTNVTLKEFNDINVWLGRGQWNDPLFVGSFNECRVYDTALTAEEIALSYLAGPDELPEMPAPCDVDIAGDLNNDCVMDLVDAAMLADQFLTQKLNLQMEE